MPIMTIVNIALWLLAAALAALWLGRTASRGTFRAKTRVTLITAGVDVMVALALVRALAPPPGVWSWLWLPAAAVVGLGLAGAIRRWSHLPWRRPKGTEPGPQPTGRTITGALAYAALGAAMVVVLA
jgi:hypothetical protein